MLRYQSVRKAAITIFASGCTVSKTMDYVCLRACGSMGPIKDWYTHYEKVGDKFAGRSVTDISSWQHNLEYIWFIGIGQTHLWAQNMKWWHLSKTISWEGQMCLVQHLSLYNFYLHVYDFIILTLTRTYIKTTTCGHQQFLLLQTDQNIFKSLLLTDIHGLARPTLPTSQ